MTHHPAAPRATTIPSDPTVPEPVPVLPDPIDPEVDPAGPDAPLPGGPQDPATADDAPLAGAVSGSPTDEREPDDGGRPSLEVAAAAREAGAPGEIRVRFPPSPTGNPHVGLIRSALYNWAFARHHGGTLVLRIEDTDAARDSEQSYRGLLDALRWLEIDWDMHVLIFEDYLQFYDILFEMLK